MDRPIATTIEIESGGEVKTIELKPEHFTIDPTNVDWELCNLGRIMLDYAQIEVALRAEVDRKESQLDKLEADKDSEVRTNATQKGTKITEAGIKNTIASDPTVHALVQSIDDSKKNYNMMRWAMEALKRKTDCLIALAYRERQLMKMEN